jgi:hypothetical protein
MNLELNQEHQSTEIQEIIIINENVRTRKSAQISFTFNLKIFTKK